jgi:hypothetical protein
MKLTITHGIRDRAMPTRNVKSKAFAAYSSWMKIPKIGIGSVFTVKEKSGSLLATLRIDSYMN